jgi:hypothetical protein
MIKITPLLLFIILLAVLVISVIICKNCSLSEGFVTFQKEKSPLDLVSIPQYSKANSVLKLYDNLFFDKINANIIEVDSTNYVSGIVDSAGVSITNTYVSKRDGTDNSSYSTTISGDVVVGRDTNESMITSVSSSYSPWSYISKSSNTDKYTLFYIPWDTSTYIHIINNNTWSNVGSYMLTANDDYAYKMFSQNSAIALSSYVLDNDLNNNTTISDSYYDPKKKLYQLSKYIRYDITNSNLIVIGGSDETSKNITIYDRSGSSTTATRGNTISNTSTTIASRGFDPWIKHDANGELMILYMPYKTNTVIALIQYYNSSKNGLKLANVFRFTPNGLEKSSSSSVGMASVNAASANAASANAASANAVSAVNPSTNLPTDPNHISDYYKWFWYWNTVGGGSPAGSSKYSDDYILKTQVVPPVCPTCPTCPAVGACTNCGGSGGSGTLSTSGDSVVKDTSNNSVVKDTSNNSVVKDTSNNSVVKDTGGNSRVSNPTNNSAGGVMNNAVNTTGGLLYAGGSGATNLVKDAGSGATNLVKDAGSGAVDLVKSVGGGVGHVFDKTLDTTTDLLKSTGSGIVNLGRQGNSGYQMGGASMGGASMGGASMGGASMGGASMGGASMGGVGIATSSGSKKNPVDNYSYYGALPSKGSSNYMPITADFSAFGK